MVLNAATPAEHSQERCFVSWRPFSNTFICQKTCVQARDYLVLCQICHCFSWEKKYIYRVKKPNSCPSKYSTERSAFSFCHFCSSPMLPKTRIENRDHILYEWNVLSDQKQLCIWEWGRKTSKQNKSNFIPSVYNKGCWAFIILSSESRKPRKGVVDISLAGDGVFVHAIHACKTV